jgi:transposase-like protein
MANLLKNPIFSDETKAREWLEGRVWPQGPHCPHCGNAEGEKITKLEGKAHRPGLYQCNGAACREQFTVTVGTVFERSKLPLTKWLAVLFLLTSSKKGLSTHQIHRTIGVSYKSTWYMTHRLREAMRTGGLAPLGGEGKIVEADETYFGNRTIRSLQSNARETRTFTVAAVRLASVPSWRLLNVAVPSARFILPLPMARPSPTSCKRTSTVRRV